MSNWIVEFYQKENGRRPAEEFLLGLPVKMRNKADLEIDLLKTFGNQLRGKYTKYVVDGVFELRMKFGSSITRIFYFFFIQRRIILAHGFVKKTQKTPVKEINKALKYKVDFERRNAKDV